MLLDMSLQRLTECAKCSNVIDNLKWKLKCVINYIIQGVVIITFYLRQLIYLLL